MGFVDYHEYGNEKSYEKVEVRVSTVTLRLILSKILVKIDLLREERRIIRSRHVGHIKERTRLASFHFYFLLVDNYDGQIFFLASCDGNPWQCFAWPSAPSTLWNYGHFTSLGHID